jgi:nucleoid-associated protein YgaU
VVVPGDHLWALADAELAAGAAVPPTGVAVDDYWMRVIRANPQLGDPDLLFPGEVVVLPPVPGR